LQADQFCQFLNALLPQVAQIVGDAGAPASVAMIWRL